MGSTSGISPQYIHGAGALVLAAAGAAFAYFQARPVMAARAQVRALTTELVEKRESLTQIQASRKNTDAQVATAKAQLAERLVALVSTSHLNERLEQLSKLAEEAGMTVDRLTPAEAPSKGPFPSLQLRLIGRGAPAACEKLIEKLHGSFVDTAITSMRVKGTPENDEAPVNLDLELLWYTAADATIGR